MADVIKPVENSETQSEPYLNQTTDVDPAETREWLESMQYVIKNLGQTGGLANIISVHND